MSLIFGAKRGRDEDDIEEVEEPAEQEEEEQEDGDEEEDEDDEPFRFVLPPLPEGTVSVLADLDDDSDETYAPYESVELTPERVAAFSSADYTVADIMAFAMTVGRFDERNSALMRQILPGISKRSQGAVVVTAANAHMVDRFRKLASSYLRAHAPGGEAPNATRLRLLLNPVNGYVTAEQVTEARAEYGDTPLKTLLAALDKDPSAML